MKQLSFFDVNNRSNANKIAVCTNELMCRGNKIKKGDKLDIKMEQGKYYIFYLFNNYEGILKENFEVIE